MSLLKTFHDKWAVPREHQSMKGQSIHGEALVDKQTIHPQQGHDKAFAAAVDDLGQPGSVTTPYHKETQKKDTGTRPIHIVANGQPRNFFRVKRRDVVLGWHLQASSVCLGLPTQTIPRCCCTPVPQIWKSAGTSPIPRFAVDPGCSAAVHRHPSRPTATAACV